MSNFIKEENVYGTRKVVFTVAERRLIFSGNGLPVRRLSRTLA